MPIPAAAPAGVVTNRAGDVETLLAEVERRRPTLGELLRSLFVSGEVHTDRVELVLRPAQDRDRELLEDPVELTALAGMAGCPGPWRIRFESADRGPDDQVGSRLIDTFGGQEETP